MADVSTITEEEAEAFFRPIIVIIRDGFKKTNRQIRTLGIRVTHLEDRVDNLEDRLDSIEEKFDGFETVLGNILERLDSLNGVSQEKE